MIMSNVSTSLPDCITGARGCGDAVDAGVAPG